MGVTAAIVTGVTAYAASKMNANQKKKDVTDIQNAAATTQAALTPPKIPPMPDAGQANIDAANAMTQAAMRVRRTASGGGYGSTILTSPTTTASVANVSRKTLLGQ